MIWLTSPPPKNGRWFAARLRGDGLVAVGQHSSGWRARTRITLPLNHPFVIVPTGWGFGGVELRPGKAHEVCEAAYQLVRSARSGDWESVGRAMDAAWAAERSERLRLGEKLTTVDVAYAKARSAGAWGGRPVQGFMVLACPPDKLEVVCKSVLS